MKSVIIPDTSCLIALSNIGKIHLLEKVFETLVTTTAVSEEYGLELPDWIKIRTVRNSQKQVELEAYVDKGEASVIALAIETQDSVLIIDEKKGRNLAKQFNITCIGTLGFLLQCKQDGILAEIKPLLNQLIVSGFRINQKIINTILKQANEK